MSCPYCNDPFGLSGPLGDPFGLGTSNALSGIAMLQNMAMQGQTMQGQYNLALSAFLDRIPAMPPPREAVARKYAAEVRARNPQMQVKRIT